MGFPKDKPPHSSQVLQRWLSDFEREHEMPAPRVQRWISAMVLLAALERRSGEGDGPLALLKGGAAMELRLGLGARASRDVDVMFVVPAELGLERVREALAEPWHDFTFSVGAAEQIRELDSWRMDVPIRYRTRSWQTVVLEASGPEAEAASDIERIPPFDLTTFGLPEPPERIACLGISYQIAQKLHACTERFEDRENDRVRDVPDLVLLAGMVDDWARVTAACAAVFDGRATHDWPPAIVAEPSWEAEFARAALDLELPVQGLDEALEILTDMVARIDAHMPD